MGLERTSYDWRRGLRSLILLAPLLVLLMTREWVLAQASETAWLSVCVLVYAAGFLERTAVQWVSGSSAPAASWPNEARSVVGIGLCAVVVGGGWSAGEAAWTIVGTALLFALIGGLGTRGRKGP